MILFKEKMKKWQESYFVKPKSLFYATCTVHYIYRNVFEKLATFFKNHFQTKNNSNFYFENILYYPPVSQTLMWNEGLFDKGVDMNEVMGPRTHLLIPSKKVCPNSKNKVCNLFSCYFLFYYFVRICHFKLPIYYPYCRCDIVDYFFSWQSSVTVSPVITRGQSQLIFMFIMNRVLLITSVTFLWSPLQLPSILTFLSI